MDEAPTTACFICYNSSNRFYENVSLLQSKHSERSISAILILILGEELASEWSASNKMCFECVDKINDYDEAFEKMNSIERELKHIHQNTTVKLEKEENSVHDECPMVDVDGMNFDDVAAGDSANFTDDPFDEKPPPQSFEIHMSEENCSVSVATEFDCDQCGLTLANYAGLKIHIALAHRDPGQANCSICHKLFPNKHALETHTMRVTCKPANISCTICHEKFSGPQYLKGHMMKHDRTGNLGPPFQCEFCGIEFDKHKELLEHKTDHLNRPHYQCLECKYIGKTTKLLKQHMRTHTKWNKCDICGQGFVTASSLQTHVRNHHCDLNMECHICKQSSKSAQELQMHMRTEHDEKPSLDSTERSQDDSSVHSCMQLEAAQREKPKFECDHCGRFFLTAAGLAGHLRCMHKIGNKPLTDECDYCGMDLGSSKALTDHKKLHLNRPHFQCIDCDLVVKNKQSLKQHMQTHIGAKPYECIQCGLRFSQSSNLSSHRKKNHANETNAFECNYCGVNFDDADTMRQHREQHLTRPNFQCLDCEFRATSKIRLKQHMRLHTGKNPLYKCDECDVQFRLECDLNIHSSTHFVSCDHCGESFPSQNKLLIHSWQAHKQPGRIKCSICRKTFPNSLLLEKHAAVCRPTNFECPICHKFIIRPHNIKAHMERHKQQTVQNKSNVKCDYCGIILSSSELLDDHKKQHQSRPDFQCLQCEFTGNTNYQLKTHMRIHTRVLRHQCELCGKAFYDSSSFHSHLKYHNKLNVECYICKVRTLTVGQMQIHMRRHTGVKPFQCSECGKRFARNDYLNSHLRLHVRPK